MPNLVTKQFKLSNAKNFIEQFNATSGNSLYMFLAKPSVWSSDSEVPPDPIDNQQSYSKLWQEMIGLKKRQKQELKKRQIQRKNLLITYVNGLR